MTIIIRGVAQSTCTQRVIVVLKELGVPFEIQTVDFAGGELKSEPYLQHQPFGQIPYIIDGSFELFESRAIGRYLVTKYGNGSKLLPLAVAGDDKSIETAAKFEQAAAIESEDFDRNAGVITKEKVFKPLFGQQGNDAVAAESENTLKDKLKGYERILSKQKYLAGDDLTLADLFHLPYAHMITEKAGVQLLKSSETPNVARWWADVSSRESWAATLKQQ